MDTLQRFMANVKKCDNGCWEWQGVRGSTGYGRLRVNKQTIWTHRLSWSLHYGNIPIGLYVLHRCDNPPCVNPDHLFLGTQHDNMQDAAVKGRIVSSFGDQNGTRLHPETVRRGEKNPAAKLTTENVVEIRQIYGNRKMTYEQLGNAFNVNPATICRIIKRKKWKHVAGGTEDVSGRHVGGVR